MNSRNWANLMSLGGIAIAMGMLVDGAIVMVENIYRHLNTAGQDDARHRTDIIMDAALEVACGSGSGQAHHFCTADCGDRLCTHPDAGRR
jgi:Cu/Ag efflux pump CusA